MTITSRHRLIYGDLSLDNLLPRLQLYFSFVSEYELLYTWIKGSRHETCRLHIEEGSYGEVSSFT
jgi:hypothetical protein